MQTKSIRSFPRAKALVPPFLLDLLRKFRRPAPVAPIWKGIYSSYEDAKQSLTLKDYSAAHELADSEFDRISGILRSYRESGLQEQPARPIEIPTLDEALILPVLLGALSLEAARRVRVLDFGGGAGADFLEAVQFTRNLSLDYQVVEVGPNCEAGRRAFGSEPFRDPRGLSHALSFDSEIPRDVAPFDLLYCKSALQYSPDWKKTVAHFVSVAPRLVLLIKIPCCKEVPTFWTTQHNLAGLQMAYAFINEDELIAEFESQGYRLLHQSKLNRRYDVSGFPETHRFPQASNFLFGKKAPS